MQALSHRIYRFDDFELDALKRQLLRQGQPVTLQPKAFDLLLTLVQNGGRLFTKDDLLNLVWPDQIVEESNLTVHMSALRKALGEQRGERRFVVTEPGRGYRFVADVEEVGASGEDFSIESHTVSRIVIERETETSDESAGALAAKTEALSLPATVMSPEAASSPLSKSLAAAEWTRTATKSLRMTTVAVSAVVALASVTLAFTLYRFLSGKNSAEPFEKFKLTRLTNSGRVSDVAVSPDGKYIAYVLGESEGNSLWMQQVGTASNVRLLAPVKAQVYELTFTPDGLQICYSLFGADNADLEFFRISSLGGVSEKIPNVIASFIEFSPDGKRIAYVQSDSPAGKNYLVIADADGSNQQTIAEKDQPNTFESNAPVVAWSPDGETIACLVNHFEAEASYSSIVGINVREGSEKRLSEQRWYDVLSIEWLKSGSGLLISASDKVSGSSQIRFLSYPQGATRQITNDLNQYDSLSATADGKSFVTIQSNTVNGIYVGAAGADASEFAEILSETGELQPLVWTPAGKIIYRSTKDGVSNLWTMDADGENRRQLTVKAQVDSSGICISPDGKYVVFGSWRNGKANLWRIDGDGGNLTQLTNGEVDVHPSCAPDNRTIIYQRGSRTKPTLWKVPIEGGESVQLTEFNAKWNAVSNDGTRISYFFMAERKWRLGIIPSAGGSLLQRLEVPATLEGYSTLWAPDDQSLFYISTVGNGGNVWSLPFNGSTAKPYTNFTSQLLSDFSLSPDRKHLAVSRTSSTSDAVLISSIR